MVSLVPILTFFQIITIVHALPIASSNTLIRRSLSSYDVADDLNYLSRRGLKSSQCSELDLDDLQALPGWPLLQKYASTTWGEGDFDVKINPPGYNDKFATMCVENPIHVVATGPANCTDTRVAFMPKKGSNTVTVDSGYENIGMWNITKVNTAARALLFNGKFKMPNITHPVTFDTIETQSEFINAPFNSFMTVASNKTTTNRELTTIDDHTCVGTIDNLQCIVPGKGRVRLIATGYVWIQFKEKRAPLANPKGPKHYRYPIKLEHVLKNVTDRSAYIDFVGYMNATMRSDYFDECRWNFRL